MKVHLITNCTNNKRGHLDNKVAFADILNDKKPSIQNWIKATSNNQSRDLAINTYAGDHWKVAKGLHSKKVPLWILSAGFGFISSEEEICSYDATFATGALNSVSRLSNTADSLYDNIFWWNELHSKRSEKHQYNLSSMVEEHLNDFFCISASPQYLKVILPELSKLVEAKYLTKENTIIISSRIDLPPLLKPLHILATEDFCELLQGNRISLNIRLARYLIEKIDNGNEFRRQVDERYQNLKNTAKPAKKFNRRKLPDDEIENYILSKLASKPVKASATTFLTAFRTEGFACEQKRFGKIFKRIQESSK